VQLSVCSEVQIVFAYGPTDATAPQNGKTPSFLAAFKSRLVLPLWYRLTQVVLEKWPLNACSRPSSSSSSSYLFKHQRQRGASHLHAGEIKYNEHVIDSETR